MGSEYALEAKQTSSPKRVKQNIRTLGGPPRKVYAFTTPFLGATWSAGPCGGVCGSVLRFPPPVWRFLAVPLPLWRCSWAIRRRPALVAFRSFLTRIPGVNQKAGSPGGGGRILTRHHKFLKDENESCDRFWALSPNILLVYFSPRAPPNKTPVQWGSEPGHQRGLQTRVTQKSRSS